MLPIVYEEPMSIQGKLKDYPYAAPGVAKFLIEIRDIPSTDEDQQGASNNEKALSYE